MENLSPLAERIAALRTNGETGWKQRVPSKQVPTATTKSSLQDRLSLLSSSTTTWQSRVNPKDNLDYTVKGRLEKDGKQASSKQSQPLPLSTEESKYISPSTLFNPCDYETFGSFFTSNNHNKKIAKDEQLTITDLDLSRNDLLKVKHSRPRRPRMKRQKLSAEQKVARALQTKVSYDVKLKKASVQEDTEIHLFQIKGKRQAIPILVDLDFGNLTLGDCFVLVTPLKVYCYYGDYCCLIERLKCDEFFRHYGKFKRTVKISYNDGVWDEFVSYFINVEDELSNKSLGEESDLEFEEFLTKATRVYGWKDGQFCLQGFERLDKSLLSIGFDLVLFQFPKELYLYVGKAGEDVGQAMEAINEHFLAGDEKFILFKKVKRGIEPIEFASKFDISFKFKPKSQDITTVDYYFDFVDVRDETLIDGALFGVSSGVSVMEEDPRDVSFSTISLVKYQLSRNLQEAFPTDLATFHTDLCYIILWSYNLTYTTRKLKSLESRTTCGRDRSAWFFWYGDECNVISRGQISTLFSVREDFKRVFGELNSNIQIAVEEGSEPGIFLKLFKGARYSKSYKSNVFEIKGDASCHWFEEIEPVAKFQTCGYLDFSRNVLIFGPKFDRHFAQFLTTEYNNYQVQDDDDEKFQVSHKIEKVCRIKPEKCKILVENLVDFKFVRLQKNFIYLIFGDRNILVLQNKTFSVRRYLIENLETYFPGMDFFVVFDLESSTNESADLKLHEAKDFIQGLKSGEKFLEFEDLEFFQLWFGVEDAGSYLSDSFIQDRLMMTHADAFRKLPKWRQRVMIKKLFT